MNQMSELEWARTLVVFDTETTGVDITTARVVTAYVGVLDGQGQVLQEQHWLLDPGVQIPDRAAQVHGITTEHAREHGQDAATGIGEIIAALTGATAQGAGLVIYNAPYDLGVLKYEAARYELPGLAVPQIVVDPLVIDRAVDRYRKGKRTLELVAAHYGVELENAHDAGADARAAGRVALQLANKFPRELALSPAQLHAKQQQWARDQAESFEQYMRRQVDPQFTASRGWPTYEM